MFNPLLELSLHNSVLSPPPEAAGGLLRAERGMLGSTQRPRAAPSISTGCMRSGWRVCSVRQQCQQNIVQWISTLVEHRPPSSGDTARLVSESDPHSPPCCPLRPALESGPCWSPDCGAGSSSWSVTWSCSCWAASRPLLTMRIGKKNLMSCSCDVGGDQRCKRWNYSLEL